MITLPHTTSAALSELMGRATAAMYERLGARLNDPVADRGRSCTTLVRAELTAVVEEEKVPLTVEQQRRLVRDVTDDVLGHGPLQRLLDDVDVTEIMVNGYDTVYVERAGKITLSGVKFTSEEHLRKIIERIVSKVGRRIDESSPMVDARLADGSRVNAIIAPLAYSGSTLTIRKFARDPFTVNDLIRMGTMTDEMAMLLKACVEAKLNIIVSGGTGSGKTTLLNVLSSFIPERRAHHHHRGCDRAPAPAGARGPVGVAARRTWRARARSTSATWSATRCACGQIASWSARSAAASRSTCSRP